MLSEEQLIERCKNQDRTAQKVLYDKYAAQMLGICARYVFERSEAEDILQEGFLKIFLKISEFEGRGSFEGWMKKVFVNTAITNYHKSSKYNKNHYDINEVQELKFENKTYNESDYTPEELSKIIHSLPEGYKLVFNLYAIEGYKHKEIAKLLEIDINTSKSQYSRAKKLIRKKLDSFSKIAIEIKETENKY
ncbi:MAG: sigma-70 family RNA polymerase sigma factor [Bacteroidales bacterium]|nr:sigma-70 family RNA polymerase sigma factor [Bacteroidales bacterium]MBN2757286.1 sigma-70 family RNA polymerase sigma factor [Bacteroidales bacterium]